MRAFMAAVDRADGRRRKAAIFDRLAPRLKKAEFNRYLREIDG